MLSFSVNCALGVVSVCGFVVLRFAFVLFLVCYVKVGMLLVCFLI